MPRFRWNSGDFERVRSLLRISMRPPRAGAVQVDHHPLRPSSRGGTTWTAPSRVRQRPGHPARHRHADGRCARCCGRQSARGRRCRRRCGRGHGRLDDGRHIGASTKAITCAPTREIALVRSDPRTAVRLTTWKGPRRSASERADGSDSQRPRALETTADSVGCFKRGQDLLRHPPPIAHLIAIGASPPFDGARVGADLGADRTSA